jgi:hypothetical protein
MFQASVSPKLIFFHLVFRICSVLVSGVWTKESEKTLIWAKLCCLFLFESMKFQTHWSKGQKTADLSPFPFNFQLYRFGILKKVLSFEVQFIFRLKTCIVRNSFWRDEFWIRDMNFLTKKIPLSCIRPIDDVDKFYVPSGRQSILFFLL